MDDTKRVLPFKRPGEKVRLPHPSAEEKRTMVDAALELVGDLEAEDDAVGFAMVVLYDDGKRKDAYGAQVDGYPQVARVLRLTARDMLKHYVKVTGKED